MGKLAPDEMLDASLDYVATGNYMVVCSGSPATYEDAVTNNVLAGITVTSGCFTKADDTSGRKLTIAAQTGLPISDTGFAEAVAIVDTSASTLLYVTTCTGQTLTTGGTVSTNEWKINIQDPT